MQKFKSMGMALAAALLLIATAVAAQQQGRETINTARYCNRTGAHGGEHV